MSAGFDSLLPPETATDAAESQSAERDEDTEPKGSKVGAGRDRYHNRGKPPQPNRGSKVAAGRDRFQKRHGNPKDKDANR